MASTAAAETLANVRGTPQDGPGARAVAAGWETDNTLLQQDTRQAGNLTARQPRVAAESSGLAGTDPKPEAELRFLLSYYPIDNGIAVLNEVPWQRESVDREQVEALLAGILLAMGVPTGGRRLHSELFRWPLSEAMSSESLTAEHAGQALSGFIRQCRDREGFRNLLVCSAQIADLLPGTPRPDQAFDYRPPGESYAITRTHALHSLLALPTLKKETWSHLQGLRMRLQTQ